jgi:hypothetical protein
MSATDDAPSLEPAEPVPHSGPHRVRPRLIVTGALVAGALLGMTAGPRLLPGAMPLFASRVAWRGPSPAVGERPWPARAGESVELGDGGATLVAFAPTPEGARDLAQGLQARRLGGWATFGGRRAALRARWTSAVASDGSTVALDPAVRCAALLRGWAEAWRGLAEAPEGLPGELERPENLRAAETEIAAQAMVADPAGLERALADLARLERARLVTRARALPVAGQDDFTARWRLACGRRAEDLESVATGLEANLDDASRALVAGAVPGCALGAEPLLADPSMALIAAPPWPGPGPARPVAASWAAFALAGALGGMIVLLPASRALAGLAHADRDALARGANPRTTADPELARAPEATSAWLQIVSGSGRRPVAGAALELATRFLARGERVLLVDGGRRLRLHRVFRGQARLGLRECLTAHMPVLGVIQATGVPGLFLLARGAALPASAWTQLDRLLEEARPHFGHLVLALEPSAPHEVGSMLAGRVAECWWGAATGGLPRASRVLSTRIGIVFYPLVLHSSAEKSLEELLARSRAAAPSGSASDERPATAEASDPVAHAAGPRIMDCELQVRERLRFLIWMRRVQAESRREASGPLDQGLAPAPHQTTLAGGRDLA